MKSIKDRIKGIAWYYWLSAACVFLYLLFISLSYLYLPGKLKQVTETDVSRMAGRKITAGDIHFNPFKLSLTVADFYVADTPEEPLVSWDRLLVNFSFWRSIFSWEIAYSEISLDNPYINIVKLKEGFNFSEVVERLSKLDSDSSNDQGKPDEVGSVAIEIFNTSINNGTFKYTDKSGTATAVANLEDISLVIRELYFATGDDHLNPFSIEAKNQKGGEIKLTGNYRINPLYVEGKIGAEGINLQALSKFLENIVPLRLSKGSLSLDTNFLVEKDTDYVLKTDDGNLSINDLLLDDDVPDPAMMSAGDINVRDFSFDLAGREIIVENVLLDSIVLNQWIDENGRPRFERLFPETKSKATGQEASSGDKEKGEAPWNIMVKKVSLKKGRINFEDLNEKITKGHSLSEINLDISDVSFSPDSRIPIRLSAVLDDKGSLNIEGALSPSPFSMELNYHLDKILLKPFSEYLETSSWLSIEDGSLSLDGKMSVSNGTVPSVNTAASLGVDDFKLQDTRTGNPVLGFKSFKIDDLKADADNRKVSIASVTLSKPDLSVTLSEKKVLNLADLIKEKKVEAEDEGLPVKGGKSGTWTFEIDKVTLDNGTVLFSDKSVKPAFKTGLYNMVFSMGRIGSDINDTAPFTFKTDIDKYAPLTVTGSFDPLDKQPGFVFQSRLKGLDMSHLSPYSGVYIGSKLKSGKLSLDLDYSLHNRKLKGKNDINTRNLYLGEKLPVKPVIDAPVGLGLALLRDISGAIDFDVAIAGDLDDPGFSVSGIIVKTLVNIIIKAAASPFKILGALVPGGGDGLGSVTFLPGDSSLSQEGRDSLKSLVDALNKRPELALSVKGNASDTEDIEALKIMRLKKLVSEKRGIAMSSLEDELKVQELWMIPENRPALEAINSEMGLTPVKERVEKLRPADAGEDKQKMGAQGALETEQGVYRRVYDDILAASKIENDGLIALADERALSIKQYLVETLKLGDGRVSIINTTDSDLSGRVIRLDLDAI